MIRRPPRSKRTDTPFPTRRSADLNPRSRQSGGGRLRGRRRALPRGFRQPSGGGDRTPPAARAADRGNPPERGAAARTAASGEEQSPGRQQPDLAAAAQFDYRPRAAPARDDRPPHQRHAASVRTTVHTGQGGTTSRTGGTEIV